VVAPSLCRIADTCTLAVLLLMNGPWPISRLLSPLMRRHGIGLILPESAMTRGSANDTR
jgi:hypothetical protein